MSGLEVRWGGATGLDGELQLRCKSCLVEVWSSWDDGGPVDDVIEFTFLVGLAAIHGAACAGPAGPG